MRYKINPFPAVRVNWKNWRFTDRAKEYHSKMEHLRLLVWWDKEKIIKALISWKYYIKFNIEMPKSWSKKKKEEMEGQPHRQTPDIDNLIKSVFDTIFYIPKWLIAKFNDKEVYKINADKYWNNEGNIEFYEL